MHRNGRLYPAALLAAGGASWGWGKLEELKAALAILHPLEVKRQDFVSYAADVLPYS
jgi:hypothetical protein